ncbi:oligosaccharide flippase family protein [Beijerinckia sp. L45]|uniref:oligosaccharide flippase family protein n=1 Tax=Beijerinckia sp. L45 TaxID=1641855 RepID=UPI00131DFFCE|nr:oligosaccharide flippase family protein [Beijerinckia sp. L45]
MRRAIVWTFGGQVLLFIVQMGSQIALARLLTPREMGVFAVAMATTSLVSAVQGIGLNQLIIREPGDKIALLETIFTINALMSLLLAAAIYALGTVGAAFYHDESIRGVMEVLALPPILGLFQFLPAAVMQRDMQFHWITVIGSIRVILIAAVTITLAILGFGTMSLGWGAVAGALANTILFCMIGRRHLVFRLRLREWRFVTTFGLQMLAISGVTMLSGRVADLLLGRILGLGALGIFSRASGINALLWENIHAVLGRIFLSDLAQRRRDGQSLRLSYLRILEALTAMLWPAFAGLAVLAGPLVESVYGRQWTDAALPLSLLCISSMILISVSMTWEIFVICGETGRQAKLETLRNLVGLGAFSLGCLVSLSGAAVGRIVDAAVSVTIYRRPLQSMTDTTWRDLVPIYARSLALTIVAVAPALALMARYRFSYETPFGYCILSGMAGIALWFAALQIMDHPLYRELKSAATALLAKVGSQGARPADVPPLGDGDLMTYETRKP